MRAYLIHSRQLVFGPGETLLCDSCLGSGREISVFDATRFHLKDAFVRTILGVNWGSEGVAADDDTNSFQTVFILQPMKHATLAATALHQWRKKVAVLVVWDFKLQRDKLNVKNVM